MLRAHGGLGGTGMMQVPSQVKNYNYPLVAHQISQLAVELGTRVSQTRREELAKAQHATKLLLLLVEALGGDPQVRNSGIANVDSNAIAPYLEKKVGGELRLPRWTTIAPVSRHAAPRRTQKKLDAAIDDLKTAVDGKAPGRRARACAGRPSLVADGAAAAPREHRPMDDAAPPPEPVPVVLVSEIRDYDRINAELTQLLDRGHAVVRLAAVEGQRLLAAGLRGAWNATVIVEGNAGPELAAELDATALTIICEGSAADGAGRALRAGTLLIRGDAGDAVGYGQSGGTIVVAGDAGARAGLALSEGVLVLLGAVGRLAGDRQSGGLILVHGNKLGPHANRGQRGGQLVKL